MSLDPSDFEGIEPQAMRWLSDGSAAITWPGGHESVYSQPYLRAQCPCASCKGTHGEATTRVAEAPAQADEPGKKKGVFAIRSGPKPPPAEVAQKIVAVVPVGNYAIRFTWGDDHDTGLYSFRYLRALCTCAACTAEAPQS